MKKKVAFFIKNMHIGGTERVLVAHLQGLASQDKYDLELIINRDDVTNVLLNDVPKNVNIKYIYSKKYDDYFAKVSFKRKKNLYYRTLYQILLPLSKKYREWKIAEMVKTEKIDVLVDFERSFVKCAEKFKCKKILWNHFTLSRLNQKDQNKWSNYFDKYDAVVAISSEMEKEIKSFYSEEKKVHMLYNPQSTDKILNQSFVKENLSDEELELLNDNYITFVGRIVKVKGLEDLLECYKALENEIKEKLYIIGSGKEKENLEKLVEKMNLSEKVIFLGNKENPYIWMRNAKLFVTTTYGEGLPTTYIESMICGTPVLSYDSPTGPKDILGDGKHGALVSMGDKEQFTLKLKDLLENKEKIEKYKNTMKEKLKEFERENVSQKFSRIIDEIR